MSRFGDFKIWQPFVKVAKYLNYKSNICNIPLSTVLYYRDNFNEFFITYVLFIRQTI